MVVVIGKLVGVLVGVGVAELATVVGVAVWVGDVETVGLAVGVLVAVRLVVGVLVGVRLVVGVLVGVRLVVGVLVGVRLALGVLVGVRLVVGVLVGVRLALGVLLGVGVAVASEIMMVCVSLTVPLLLLALKVMTFAPLSFQLKVTLSVIPDVFVRGS